MRVPKDTDFSFDVEGVGSFVFGRRTFGDRIAIRREYARLTQNVDDIQLASLAVVASNLKVLMVSGPAGWNPDALETMDFLMDEEGAEDKLFAVYDALRATEDSFRKGSDKTGEGSGAGNVADDVVLVSEEVQPAAERPGVSGAHA